MTREISVVKNAPHKGCNSSSCCSPAKLWRSIQAFIKSNDEKGLVEFFKDSRQEHIVRVALTSRISNDASMFPPSQQHKLIRIEERKLEVNKYLGKSFNDLNSLQLALITSSESMVLTLLAQLKLHATPQQLKLFLHHIWGQGNTSLHLAVFLKRHAVVKTLIDLGCQPDHHLNARKKTAVDCCYYSDQRMIHLLSLHKRPETKSIQVKPDPVPMTTAVDTTNQDKATTVDVKLTNELLPLPQEEVEVKKEMTLEECYAILLNQQSQYICNHIKNCLSIAYSGYNHVLYQDGQEQPFVSLAQIKKPPDILGIQYHLQKPYDTFLLPISC